jgi:serine/threonine-protein kinase
MSRALGRYELLRPLARGGMGEVYLARRRAGGIEKWLVVKRMRPERAGDARFLDLFMREARLSMSLAHQNIVPVFDFGRIDDQVFLAMERIEGKDLGSSLHQAGTPLPAMLAAFIAAECCQALDYAHHRRGPDGTPLGIVHRDVTPRNVLLSWSGEIKLTDFGIAALAHDVVGARSAIGTPAYMAPEQARGEPTDARSDLYALGLVLREAWTGTRARGGTDRESTLAAAREAVLEPWPDGSARYDGVLRAIADRATAAAPDDRYPDARSMLEALDAFIVDERAAKKGDGPARQLAAWLASTWQDEREEGAIEEAIEGNHLVSFLDDGAIDVLGTGTQRSMLATAADEPPVELPSAVAPPPAVVEPPPAVEPPPSVAPRPAPTRRPWLLAAPIVIVGAFLAIRAGRHHAEPVERLPPPAPAVAVTPPPPPPPADIKPVAVHEPVVVEHPLKVHETARPRKLDVVKAGSAAAPTPAVVKHRALIGSRPWSDFTVDADPTKYEGTTALDLAPGPHTIHYLGQPNFKADQTVTIDMPDRDGFTHVETLKELTPPASP